VQVDPMNPKLKPPGTKRLKLKCDILLSTSGFKLNLRRYKEVDVAVAASASVVGGSVGGAGGAGAGAAGVGGAGATGGGAGAAGRGGHARQVRQDTGVAGAGEDRADGGA
jgi:hypothetical protein